MGILIGILFVLYCFLLCYRMLIEGTDEYIDKSMERAYRLAELMEGKENDR